MRNSNQHPHCHACTVAEVVRDIRITATALCEIFGIERQVAIDKAICLAEKNHGIDLSAIKPLARAIKMEARTIGLDSIGARLGIRAKDVNLLLQNAGLQMKIGKERRITSKGKCYGKEMPFERNGHSGYQIRWNESVVDALRREEGCRSNNSPDGQR